MATTHSSTFWSRLPSSRAFYICINALQMMAGITTLSLCGSDISEYKDYTARKVFTMVVSTLSILTSLSLMTEIFHSVATRVWLVLVFCWQWILVFLWGTAAIIMSTVYLRGPVRTRMRVATGFVYLNLVVWALCSIVGTIGCCAGRRKDDTAGNQTNRKNRKDRKKKTKKNKNETNASKRDGDGTETRDADALELGPTRGSAST